MLKGRTTWQERNLWYIIPTLPVALATAAVAAGASPLLSSIFVVVLLFWPWLAHQEGPPPEENPTYGFLRNIRVKLYFAGLIFYMLLNVVLLSISVYLFLLFFLIWPLRAWILRGIYQTILRSSREAIKPRGSEVNDFAEMAMRVGGSTIYLSWAILYLDIILAIRTLAGGASITYLGFAPIAILYLIIASVVMISWYAKKAWARETESRQYAKALADSLIARRWWLGLTRRKQKPSNK